MRILTINNTADRYGASRCMERVYGALAEKGHEIHAVLPGEGPLVHLLRAHGVHVHLHPGLPVVDRHTLKSMAGRLRFLAAMPASVLYLARLILRERIDLVHTNTVVLTSPSLAAFLTRTPHVWHVRELLEEFGALWHPYQRWVCSLSSAVLAISQCVRDQFALPLQQQVHVVYDGLPHIGAAAQADAVAGFRAQFPKEAVLIGVVGRIKWHRKGQEVLVRAAALLHSTFPDCRFVVAGTASPGNEEHATRLQALVQELGVAHAFCFVGEVEDTASLFAALDMAVVPSVQPEPFGCVVIEAMDGGAVVLGSAAGGIAEQIVDGESGLLFRPGDAEDLARQLATLLTNAELRARLASGGRYRVQTQFKLETTIADMLAIFERCGRRRTKVNQSGRAERGDSSLQRAGSRVRPLARD